MMNGKAVMNAITGRRPSRRLIATTSHTATRTFSTISGRRMTATDGRASQKNGVMIQASTARM